MKKREDRDYHNPSCVNVAAMLIAGAIMIPVALILGVAAVWASTIG